MIYKSWVQTIGSGDFARVKKGVWEESVDAAGGEVLPGSEQFIPQHPKDANETLLHIAARQGNIEFVEWLDNHGKSSHNTWLNARLISFTRRGTQRAGF